MVTSTKEKIVSRRGEGSTGHASVAAPARSGRQGVKKGQSPGSEIVNHHFFSRGSNLKMRKDLLCSLFQRYQCPELSNLDLMFCECAKALLMAQQGL